MFRNYQSELHIWSVVSAKSEMKFPGDVLIEKEEIAAF
jgi:hypothetical protein